MPLTDVAIRNAKPRPKPYKLGDSLGLLYYSTKQQFRPSIDLQNKARFVVKLFRYQRQNHQIISINQNLKHCGSLRTVCCQVPIIPMPRTS